MPNNSNPLVLRDFSIEQLLRRESVVVDMNEISKFLSGKRVLVTGAAGSIGNELVRQIAKFNPEAIIFFDHNENNQFFLEKEMIASFPNIKIIPRIGSIADRERAKAIFEETVPHIVYHAAANKHVPLSESNPSETIQNNILGTHVIADMASDFNCEAFVLISTDKAVKPTSVMGATKRIAEYYVQIKSKQNLKTRFVTVRFGNVLGSSGSVVPIFKSQIEAGGPITVTHPDMYRFFMTIPEASQLLLQASAFALSGEIFVLDMGEPVKILDLAKNMIELMGLKPDVDIKIQFSGIRPGEKIFEELSFDNETTELTQHPKIRNTKTPLPSDNVFEQILHLENLPADSNPYILKLELSKLIPESKLNLKEKL
jgi:FlaA1/EpsC-like NDP-sugar epimerase